MDLEKSEEFVSPQKTSPETTNQGGDPLYFAVLNGHGNNFPVSQQKSNLLPESTSGTFQNLSKTYGRELGNNDIIGWIVNDNIGSLSEVDIYDRMPYGNNNKPVSPFDFVKSPEMLNFLLLEKGVNIHFAKPEGEVGRIQNVCREFLNSVRGGDFESVQRLTDNNPFLFKIPLNKKGTNCNNLLSEPLDGEVRKYIYDNTRLKVVHSNRDGLNRCIPDLF